MKLAMAQMSMGIDIKENVDKTLNIIEECGEADLLFFPEIQLSPFFPQYEKSNTPYEIDDYILKKNHPYIKQMMEAAKKNQLYISPNIYLQNREKKFDASLWITPQGELEGISTMVHVLQAEKFYEKDYYTPSVDGFHVYETPFGKIGIVICFDRHLPESIRTCALMGAQLILVPTANISTEPLEMFEWEIRVQAMQNNVFIAMCNRVGTEGEITFAGESLVIDPDGNIIVKADDTEQNVIVDIDLKGASRSRKDRPYIKTRRPGFYK